MPIGPARMPLFDHLGELRRRLTIVVVSVFAAAIVLYFATPVVLVFSERQVDVLSAWDGEADCTVITRLSVLPKLRNRQQLTALIRSGDLEVQGDLQVVQNMVSLCDLAEFDPAELLAPYTGDIVAEGVGKVLRGGAQFLLKGAERQQRYVAEAITEEWRLAPGPLELAWFARFRVYAC